MWYSILADAVVAFHVTYMAFILFGLLAVIAGKLRGWGWVQNLWFRVLHLLAIVVVAVEAMLGFTCPLTDWEDQLRQKAGQAVEQGTFVGRLLHNLLFYDNVPAWIFTTCYISFALLVAVTLIWAPPRWRRLPAAGGHA